MPMFGLPELGLQDLGATYEYDPSLHNLPLAQLRTVDKDPSEFFLYFFATNHKLIFFDISERWIRIIRTCRFKGGHSPTLHALMAEQGLRIN